MQRGTSCVPQSSWEIRRLPSIPTSSSSASCGTIKLHHLCKCSSRGGEEEVNLTGLEIAIVPFKNTSNHWVILVVPSRGVSNTAPCCDWWPTKAPPPQLLPGYNPKRAADFHANRYFHCRRHIFARIAPNYSLGCLSITDSGHRDDFKSKRNVQNTFWTVLSLSGVLTRIHRGHRGNHTRHNAGTIILVQLMELGGDVAWLKLYKIWMELTPTSDCYPMRKVIEIYRTVQ